MFADDTNFFYSGKNIKHVFDIFNKELKIIQSWFNGNKLSLNIFKKKYAFFHSLKIKFHCDLQNYKLTTLL